MGKNKRFLSIVGLGLLIIGIIFIISNFIGKDEFQIDPENITIFEEDHSVYYVKKVPKDFTFDVFIDDSTEQLEYKFVDEEGNEVEARVKKKNDDLYEIRAPRSGYDEGVRYRLELGQGAHFAHEELVHAESLVFAAERDPIEHYKFTDQVVELEQEITYISADMIEVENYDFKEDEIAFGLDENGEYVVYKVSEVLEEGIAKIDFPAIDEIYSELEVYGEYEFDFNDIVSNPEIEATIVNNMKNSDFYSLLLKTAYGEESNGGKIDIEVEIEKNANNNSLQFKVILTLKAGENGLFAKKALKHHEVKLTLISELGTNVTIDIDNVKNWDVAAVRSESFAWEVDINYQPPKIDESYKLTDLFEQDNEDEIMEITRLLNDMVSDETKNDLKLFEHGIPVAGVPGLIISLEINIALALELQANLNFNNDYSAVTTVGLMYRDNHFNPYFQTFYDRGDGEATIKGKLNSKAGINFEVKTKLFHDKVAYMSVKPEVGLYADAYVVITMNNLTVDKDRSNGYFESGTYFNAQVEGHLNLLLKKYDFQDEIDEVRNKFEKLSFGDYKITAGIEADNLTMYAKDFLASPPNFTFTYYDIRNEEEVSSVLHPSEISYSLEDGKEVEREGEKLVIPKTDLEEITVIAEYKDDNNRVYSTILTIYISENRTGGLIDHEDFEEPLHLAFLSGAGAWSTVIELYSDGSFTGKYEDANAWMPGNGHTSTNYISEFTGWFGEIESVDEETYSMKLLDINYEHEPGEEWIEDHVKYIASEAYGFEEGEDFYLYSPNKQTNDLNEELLSWGGGHGSYEHSQQELLLYWVLHNRETDYGFYSEPYLDDLENDLEEVTGSSHSNTIPTSFEHINFDHNYSGPGSEYIGTWHIADALPVDLAPNPWEINYYDETFYIRANLPGDPAIIIMTAEYKNGRLHSNNGTQVEFSDYASSSTMEVELPETVAAGDETSQFFFENGNLQWFSELRGDFSDYLPEGIEFPGYTKE